MKTKQVLHLERKKKDWNGHGDSESIANGVQQRNCPTKDLLPNQHGVALWVTA